MRQSFNFGSSPFLTILLFLMAFQAYGGQPTEHQAPDIRYISTNDLKMLLDSSQECTLVNVLPKIIYDAMHIPGSINHPIGRLEKDKTYPFPKSKPLVFYCMGVL
jgi:hypothetical protein